MPIEMRKHGGGLHAHFNRCQASPSTAASGSAKPSGSGQGPSWRDLGVRCGPPSRGAGYGSRHMAGWSWRWSGSGSRSGSGSGSGSGIGISSGSGSGSGILILFQRNSRPVPPHLPLAQRLQHQALLPRPGELVGMALGGRAVPHGLRPACCQSQDLCRKEQHCHIWSVRMGVTGW